MASLCQSMTSYSNGTVTYKKAEEKKRKNSK